MQSFNSSQIEVFNLTAVRVGSPIQDIKRVEADTPTSPPLHSNYTTQKSIRELFYNGTGYYIDDEGETGDVNLLTKL